MGSIDEIVAVNILVRMKDLNIDQLTLAKLSGLSKDHLNKLLKQKKSVSKSTSLPKIAEALQCAEADLYQDPKYVNDLAVTRTVSANHEARFKEMNRMLAEQLGEALNDLKARFILSSDEQDLIANFRGVAPERRKSVIEFAKTAAVPRKPQVRAKRSR